MPSSKARYLSILARDLNATGQVPSSNLLLSDTGVSAGTYGSASLVPVLTIDTKGRVTTATTSNVAGVTSFGYNTGSGRLTINTADGASFIADVTLAPFSTTTLAEGTNQYFTTARARSSISASGSLSYNSSTGALTYTQDNTDTVSEGATNLYFTSTRARAALSATTGSAAYNNTSGVITIPSTSSHITEGSNLFYTDTRVRAALSGSTGVTYNSSTGAIAIGQAVGSSDSVTFNSVTVNGTLTSDDITSTNITASGNLTVSGDLTVSGTTTTVNSTTVSVADINIELARNATTAAQANGAGITITGPTTAATLAYTSADDRWNLNKDLTVSNVYGNLTGAVTGNASTATTLQTTRSIATTGDGTWTVNFDGSANVTSALTLATVNATVGTYGSSTLVPVITVNAKGLITSVTTSSISGALTFTGDVTGSGTTGASTALTLATVNANVGTFTKLTVNGKGLVTAASAATTTDIGEGTNLYYTDTRARAAHSFAAGSGAYSSATGVITIPTNNNQLTNGAGYITGYTEVDTLATVTGRGATTSTALTFSGGITSAGATLSGNLLFNNATSPNTNYIQFGDNTGWYLRIMTSVSGTPTQRFSFSDQGAFSAVGTIGASNFSGSHSGTSSGTNTGDQTNISGTAAGETLATITGRGATTSTLVRFNNQLQVGQNTNGTAYIDAYGGFAYYGADSNSTGIRVNSSGNVRIGGGNTSPNSTAFSHTIAGVSSSRVVNFDGNGSNPSVWWTNGATALFAIDGTTNGATFWANSSGNWQQQMSVTYGTVNVDTTLQQGGNQVLHAGNYTSYAMPAGSSATNSVDVRAPIFYDSGNTAYYTDPNGTSNLVGLTVANTISGSITGTAGGETLATVTGRGATTTTAVAIGASSVPNGKLYVNSAAVADTLAIQSSTTGTYLVFADNTTPTWANAPRIGAINNDLLLTTLATGRVRITSAGDVIIGQSAISYSVSDNTAVVGSIATNKLHVNGSIQLTGNNDAIVFGSGTSTFLKDEELGFGWGGGWYMTDSSYLRVRGSKILYNDYIIRSDTDMRAPIFYDVSDTSYYVDPNSTTAAILAGSVGLGTTSPVNTAWGTASTTKQITIYGSGYGVLNLRGDQATAAHYSLGVGGTRYYAAYDNVTTVHRMVFFGDYTGFNGVVTPSYNIHLSGTGYATGDWRAPIFYDSNDTAYYVDPNSNSRLSSISVPAGSPGFVNAARGSNYGYSGAYGTIIYGVTSGSVTPCFNVDPVANTSGSFNGNGSEVMFRNGVQFISPNSANTSYNSYFNLTDGYLQANNSLRAPIFYDSNDTAYYVDPNSNSKFVNLGLGGATPDVRLSVSGDTHLSNVLHLGGTAGSVNSWGSRDYTTSGLRYFNASTYEFNNYGYGSTYTFTINGSLAQHSSSVRAPIFYDSDNTGYYVDPASTSNFVQINLQGILRRNTSAAGYLEGNYPTSTDGNSSAAIYTIGGSYQPASTTLGNMYGVGYTVGSGTANPGLGQTGWGFYVASNGTSRIFLDSDNGVGIASASFRAPIFYDSNNTGYYVDPASTSSLVGLTVANTISGSITGTAGAVSWPNVTSGTRNDYNLGFQAPSSGYAGLYFNSSTGSGAGYLLVRGTSDSFPPYTAEGITLVTDANSLNLFARGTTVAGGNAWVRMGTGSSETFRLMGDYSYSLNSSRAPIFYDSDDTTYYADPNSRSVFYRHNVGSSTTIGTAVLSVYAGGAGGVGWSTGLNVGDSSNYTGLIQDAGTSRWRNFGNGNWDWYNSAATVQIMSLSNGGSLFSSSDMRSPIFYDSNDTAYYTDPNSRSSLSTWKTADTNELSWIGTSVSTSNQFGIGFNTTDTNYAIYKNAGAWIQPLNINFWVGIRHRTNPGYDYGTSFWNTDGTLQMSVGAGDNNVRVYSDIRAPIFYDYNNTAYFVNPNSNSLLSSLVIDGDFRTGFLGGAGGSNFAANHYSMGKDIANGSWTSPHYSDLIIGYHTGIRIGGMYSGVRFYANSPTTDANNDGNGDGGEALLMTVGGYVGTANYTDVYVNNNLFAGSSMRAPIFYDSNNTAYYTDPASTSNLNTINSGDIYNSAWFRNTGNQGVYNSTYGTHFYSNSTDGYVVTGSGGVAQLQFRSNHQTTVRGYVYADTSNNIGFLTNDGNWGLRVDSSKNIFTYGTDLTVGNSTSSNIYMTDTDETTRRIHCNSNRIGFLNSSNGWGAYNSNNGDWTTDTISYAGASMRAPLFYDNNDTGYYIDPTSTSDSALRMRGGALFGPNVTWSSYLLVGGDGRQNYTNNTNTASVCSTNGNLHIDSASGLTTHINWYDGTDLIVGAGDSATGRFYVYGSSNYSQATGSMRAPLFYDSNDTAYYTDPASTSVMNRISTVRTDNWLYIDNSYGHSVVGKYESTIFQGVFAMGDSYKLTAAGAVGNLYGICYSHPNAGGAAGNLDSHGLIMLINGGFGSCMSYSIKASGNVTAYSDERLKTNWRDMPEDFVAKLSKVKVGIYDRIDGEKLTQVGVSAQSLQAVLPEAIITADDEISTLSISYGSAAMASAIELAKEIVMLKDKINHQDARINNLEKLIAKLIEVE